MDIDTINKARQLIYRIFMAVKDVQAISAIIITVFNKYCLDKGMTSEEICNALETVVRVQKRVLSETKSNGYIM